MAWAQTVPERACGYLGASRAVAVPARARRRPGRGGRVRDRSFHPRTVVVLEAVALAQEKRDDEKATQHEEHVYAQEAPFPDAADLQPATAMMPNDR